MEASSRWSHISVGTTPLIGTIWILLAQSRPAAGHGHHDELPEGQYISDEPIDSILWIHILLQIFAWGLVFPTGMVLGMVRSRWHVPFQTAGAFLAITAYFLGHVHHGRFFAKNAHAVLATPVMLLLMLQLALGIYLKLHLSVGSPHSIHARIRRFAVLTHGLVGKAMPIVAWVQMLLGGIAGLGFCRDDHLGQCIAHFIMGSAFVAYGILYTLVLLVGQLWLRRTGRSQEFFDSCAITAWGFVNTFTEHRWGHDWGGNDLQHTSMGIVWWSAGLLGMWLSWRREPVSGGGGGGIGVSEGRRMPKRNLIPALVVMITGWAMSGHPQHLMLSTKVHTAFGYTLMAAGFTRIVEIAFVLRDRAVLEEKDLGEVHSFQYLPPFLLYASGLLFMGATEQQMEMLSQANVTHVSYILLLYSVAFVMYLFVNVLVNIYSSHMSFAEPPNAAATAESALPQPMGRANGRAPGFEHVQARDAEGFELEGLMSDDGNDEELDGAGQANTTSTTKEDFLPQPLRVT